jgi:hypothetical protein
MSLVGLELGRPGRARWPGIATSLALDLTTSLFSFLFQINTHLNPTGKILGGVVITSVNIFLFFVNLAQPQLLPFIYSSSSVSYTLPWTLDMDH